MMLRTRPDLAAVRVLALLALLVTGCLSDTGGPSTITLQFAVTPVFTDIPTAAIGIVDIADAHVLIERSDGSTAFDAVIPVPAGADSLALEASVVVLSANETFSLTLEFLTSGGAVAYQGGPVAVQASTTSSNAPVPVDVTITYVGVGANAASVRITSAPATVLAGDTVTLTAEALDGQGQVIAGTPIAWSSTDLTRAVVPDPSVGTVVAQSRVGPVSIIAELLTGPADTASMIVSATLGEETWIFHASGISDFIDPDSLGSGRWFELVDPIARVVQPPLAVSRGDEEVVGLVYDPGTARVLAQDRDCDLFSVDPATGAEVLVGNTTDSTATFCSGHGYFKGMVFEPGTGRLLAGVSTDWGDGQLYEVNPATAASTPIGQLTSVQGDSIDGVNGMTVDPATGTVYVIAHRAVDVLRDRYLATVDVGALQVNLIALLPQRGVAGITFTSDGVLYAVTGDGADVPETLWTMNPATAAMTQVMPLGHGNDGEAIVAVPPRP